MRRTHNTKSPAVMNRTVAEASHGTVDKLSRRKRRASLTNTQKLLILNKLEKNEITLDEVTADYNVCKNTVKKWRRDKIEGQVQEEGHSERKRAATNDGLNRIRAGVKEFVNNNRAQSRERQIHLTCK